MLHEGIKEAYQKNTKYVVRCAKFSLRIVETGFQIIFLTPHGRRSFRRLVNL